MKEPFLWMSQHPLISLILAYLLLEADLMGFALFIIFIMWAIS